MGKYLTLSAFILLCKLSIRGLTMSPIPHAGNLSHLSTSYLRLTIVAGDYLSISSSSSVIVEAADRLSSLRKTNKKKVQGKARNTVRRAIFFCCHLTDGQVEGPKQVITSKGRHGSHGTRRCEWRGYSARHQCKFC